MGCFKPQQIQVKQGLVVQWLLPHDTQGALVFHACCKRSAPGNGDQV
jgi:hypothetical protein